MADLTSMDTSGEAFEYLFSDDVPEPPRLASTSCAAEPLTAEEAEAVAAAETEWERRERLAPPSEIVVVEPPLDTTEVDVESAYKRKEPAKAFDTYSPEEMADFMYYQFFNIDEDDRSSTTNGWQWEMLTQKERDKARGKFRNSDADVQVTNVRIPLNNEQQLDALNCRAINAFLVSATTPQYRNSIFYGSKEPPTPYLTYSFTAGKGSMKGIGQKDVYFVRPMTLKWAAIPMVKANVQHLFYNEFPGKACRTLREVMTCKLSQHKDEVTPFTLQLIEAMLSSYPSEVLRMRKTPIIKRIFCFAKLEPLYRYYKADDLESLGVVAIDTLNRYVTRPSRVNNPIGLCFVDLTRNLGLRCETHDRIWTLPELSHRSFEHLCKTYNYVPTPLERFAVKLYDLIKQHAKKGGHKFIDDDELGITIDSADRNHLDAALALLQTYKAIVIEKTTNNVRLVYLWRMYMCEKFIVNATNILISQFLTAPPRWKTPEEANQYLLRINHMLCSEQLNSIECARHYPIELISGCAGAGKSAGLTKLMAYLGAIDWKEQIMFSTYQAKNAATAAATNTPYAATAHNLMSMHASKCHLSPLKNKTSRREKSPEENSRRRAGGGRGRGRGRGGPMQSNLHRFMEREERDEDNEDGFIQCPFENVRVLVIDEIGLFFEELLAPILHVLTTCGKLSQLIVCGDHRQLVQIQPGQLQKDMFYGFERWLLKYEHCHRFEDKTAVIFRHNAMMVDAMRPEAVVFEDGIYERIEPNKKFYKPEEMKQLESELISAMRRTGFRDSEECMFVTRTHEWEEMGLRAMEIVQFGEVKPGVLRVGQKVMYTRSDKKAGIVSKQVLMLEGIEDCPLPPGKNLRWLKAKEFKDLVADNEDIKDTSWKRPRRHARRLKCRVVGERRIVYLPYDGIFTHKVVRAGATTERSSQGTQAKHIFIFKPSYWEEADVKECAYVTTTRQASRLTMFCTYATFCQWVRNPAKPRNSVLGKKLRAVCDKWAPVFPTMQPSLALQELAKEEGDKYTPKLERFALTRQY